MICFSNMADIQDYVEVLVNESCVRNSLGRHVIGYSVSINLFSNDGKYEGLLDGEGNYLTYMDALAQARHLANQFDLEEDIDLKHRKAVWSI